MIRESTCIVIAVVIFIGEAINSSRKQNIETEKNIKNQIVSPKNASNGSIISFNENRVAKNSSKIEAKMHSNSLFLLENQNSKEEYLSIDKTSISKQQSAMKRPIRISEGTRDIAMNGFDQKKFNNKLPIYK